MIKLKFKYLKIPIELFTLIVFKIIGTGLSSEYWGETSIKTNKENI
jgi:hypothetical protein